MNLQLTDKVIIVTGGAKGIGRGIVEVLSEEGAVPFIVGRNEDDNHKAVEEITALGRKCYSTVAELTRDEDCKTAVETILSTTGHIDGLVNNAGVNDGVSLEKGSADEFRDSLQKNLVHYYLMAHYALPELIKQKGSIVNIGSKTSFTGQGGTSGYAAANGGRVALTREWAVELLPYHIRVNAIIVAESMTPLYEKWLSTFPNPVEKLKSITSKIPLGNRMTTPRELGQTAAFLLSPVSSHTTGQLLFVDGGYVHLDRSL